MSDLPPSGGQRRLAKGRDRRLGGVAGGLAEYFEVDPTIVRVLFVIALFLPGIGFGVVIAYVLMWLIMPDPQPGQPPSAVIDSDGGLDATLVLGIIIVAIGLMLLLRTSWVLLNFFGWLGAGFVWPLLLIALGAYVIYSARSRT